MTEVEDTTPGHPRKTRWDVDADSKEKYAPTV